MCFAAAIPLAILATTAASAVVGFAGQKANAEAQGKLYEQNQVQALAADRVTQNSLTQRQLQEQDATTQRLQVTSVDEARRQAEAEVAGTKMGMAGPSGSGINLNNLVADIGRTADNNRVTLITNWNNTAANFQGQKDIANATEQQRVNALPQGTEPSPLTPVFQVAGAGARYFGDLQRQARPTGGDGSTY